MGSQRQELIRNKLSPSRSVVPGPSLVLSGSGSTPVFTRVASSVLSNSLSEDGSVERAMGTRCNKRSANLPPAGESLGRVGRADHKAEPGEGAQVATPSRRRLHPDDASPGSEARSASRRRRRACCYPPSGLDGVPKSSSRARRSVPYSRPAVRLLKRAVDAVKQRRCGSKDRDPLPEGGRLGPWLIYIIRHPLDAAAVSGADDGSALAA